MSSHGDCFTINALFAFAFDEEASHEGEYRKTMVDALTSSSDRPLTRHILLLFCSIALFAFLSFRKSLKSKLGQEKNFRFLIFAALKVKFLASLGGK
jgi:hypothetical protein